MTQEVYYEIEARSDANIAGCDGEWIKGSNKSFDTLKSVNEQMAKIAATTANGWEFRAVRVTVTREVL